MTQTAPVFITANPEAIEQDLVKYFEDLTGRTLYPAQDERIMIHIIAYMANLNRIAANEAATLNLVDFSRKPFVDYIGARVGVYRLEPQSAKTTFRVKLTETLASPYTILKDTQIESKDGQVIFNFDKDLTIPAGVLTADIEGIAETPGLLGNGYLSGEVKNILNPIPYVESIENITTTSGGADEEDDQPYIDRIKLAPEKKGVGTKWAYIFNAKSAHQDIVDVTVENAEEPVALTYKISTTTHTATVNQTTGAITGTGISTGSVNFNTGQMSLTFSQAVSEFNAVIPKNEGTVNVYPLTRTGAPSQEIIDTVKDTLMDEKTKPLTDNVVVISPAPKDFNVSLNAIVLPEADLPKVESELNKRIDEFIDAIGKALNESVIPSKIIEKAQSIEGVQEIQLFNPAKILVDKNEFARCTGKTIKVWKNG